MIDRREKQKKGGFEEPLPWAGSQVLAVSQSCLHAPGGSARLSQAPMQGLCLDVPEE